MSWYFLKLKNDKTKKRENNNNINNKKVALKEKLNIRGP